MTTNPEEFVVAVRDAAQAIDEAVAALKASAMSSVRVALASAETALATLTSLDAERPSNPFPIDPFDDPVTVEAVEVARVRDAARVIALRHAVTELKKVLDD